MTTQPPTGHGGAANRAASDPALRDLIAEYQNHLGSHHAGLGPGEVELLVAQHRTINDGFEPMQRDIAQILVTVEGTPVRNARGEIIDYRGGMRNALTEGRDENAATRAQVAEINATLINGGIKMTLATRDRIFVALIGGGALLGSAAITAIARVVR